MQLVLYHMKYLTRFIYFFSLLFFSNSLFCIENEDEINYLNLILEKGYDKSYVPHIINKSNENKKNCDIFRIETKEKKFSEVEITSVPEGSAEFLFRFSNNFHYVSAISNDEDIALYYNSHYLNQIKLIGADDLDRINYEFILPNNRDNEYFARLIGFKKDKFAQLFQINYNKENNNFSMIYEGPYAEKDLESYSIKIIAKCN